MGPCTPLIQLPLQFVRLPTDLSCLAKNRLIKGQGLRQFSRILSRRHLPAPRRLCRHLCRMLHLDWRWGELLAPLAPTLLQPLPLPLLHRQFVCRRLTIDSGVCQRRFVIIRIHPIA